MRIHRSKRTWKATKGLAFGCLALAVSLSVVQDGYAELARGSRLYIQPFGQFETYLAAAFSKKAVPVVIVRTEEESDLTLAILNDGRQVTGVRIENREREIVWTYLFEKPADAQLKAAEKCASRLREQFSLSPEGQAKRERALQRQEERRAGLKAGGQIIPLSNGRFAVPAGRYLMFPFRVSGPATVKGSFEVVGGSGNDIQIVIGPRSEVLNWINGHGGEVTYASEKLTSGTVNVSIAEPGDYLLAFSNLFSIVSAKIVGANIQLVTGQTQ